MIFYDFLLHRYTATPPNRQTVTPPNRLNKIPPNTQTLFVENCKFTAITA
jgi:hypothetical protein